MTEKFSFNLAMRKNCRRRGVDVSKFARASGISKSALYQAMTRDTPSLLMLERCAAGFDMALTDFIAEGYLRPHKTRVIALPAPCGADVSNEDQLGAIRAYATAAGEATYMARAITALENDGFQVVANK